MSSAEDKISKAKARLVADHPFYAIIALGLPFEEAKWCDTMATDGMRIYWGRAFVDKITINELIGVIAHETLHVAWLHMLRIGLRNDQIWNIACDIVINKTLMDGGFKLPEGGVFGPQFSKYDNWAAEAIYEDLDKNAVKVSFKFDDGNGEGGEEGKTWGGVIKPKNGNGKPLSEAEARELEEEVKIKVKEAAVRAKAIGKLPAGLEGLVKAVGKPKIDWKAYIQHWVSGHTPDNYTWLRPQRNWLVHSGIYMPRMQLNGAGHGVLSIDTSGSVSDGELKHYVREVAGVIELCNPDRLTIIQHDAIIQSVREWEAGDDFNDLKIKARGGTCIRPSFDYAEKMEEQVDWMICFTDMEIGDFPPAPGPAFPVLWCSTGRHSNEPFGTLINLRDAMRE